MSETGLIVQLGHWIIYEVCRQLTVWGPEVVLRNMSDLHDASFTLHVDDFGTGHSSLETLHRFPVDAFKIDRSFVHGLASGGRSDELVRAIVAMGKALGLAVVAEGVETSEQLAFLQRIGCASGQGFLFLPAVTGDHALEQLGRVLGKQRVSAPERS